MKQFISILLFSVLFATDLLAGDTLNTIITKPAADYKSIMMPPRKEKEEMEYTQTLTLYPFKTITNCLMLGYEKQIGHRHALKIVAGYTKFDETGVATNFDFDIKDYSGLRFDIMLKYFMGQNSRVFNGLYIAPHISFKNSKFMFRNFNDFNFPDPVWEEGAAQCISAALIVGYQIPLGKTFTLDGYVGNGIRKCSGNYNQANRILDSYRNSIGVVAGLSIGFGF